MEIKQIQSATLNCRVCGGHCRTEVTICPECAMTVFKVMKGTSDRLVLDYLKLADLPNLRGDQPIDHSSPAPKLPPIPRSYYQVREKNVPCVCGQLYSREIAVLACAARDHQLPKETYHV